MLEIAEEEMRRENQRLRLRDGPKQPSPRSWSSSSQLAQAHRITCDPCGPVLGRCPSSRASPPLANHCSPESLSPLVPSVQDPSYYAASSAIATSRKCAASCTLSHVGVEDATVTFS